MTARELFFFRGWEFHPSVLAGCVVFLGAYLRWVRPRSARQTLYFALGTAALCFALVSPLDPLGDDYLFSAHMVQHLFLWLAAPPLWLLGLPEDWTNRVLDRPGIRQAEGSLGRPGAAWFLGIGTLWAWHLPVLYNLTLASEPVHIAEHLDFLVTGTIFWWPVLAPGRARRLAGPGAILYLFLGGLANTALGILLTFAPLGYYPAYQHPEDELGALTLIRDRWGIDPKSDLELGGLFMWVLGGLVFLWAILAVLARWYGAAGETEPAPAGTPGGPGGVGYGG